MKGGMSQSLRLGQELKINPRLYQAMDMLYMPLLDLQQHLKQELLTNPFLELSDDENEDDESEAESTDGEVVEDVPVNEDPVAETSEKETDWEEILLNGFEAEGATHEQRDDREQYEAVSVGTARLEDHLREQLVLLDLTARELLLADEFIGNIGDDGYLAATLDEILEGINDLVAKAAEKEGYDSGPLPFFTMTEAEAMLAIIQRLDPPGTGARDLRECLLLQLRDQGKDTSLAARLVRDFFDELVAHRWGDVARRVGCTPAEVQKAADEIAKLNPKPGLQQSGGSDNYVIPDMVVEKIDGAYHVFINDGNLPRLKLSRIYQEIAGDKKKFDGENKEFITSKLNAAQWLIQAIEQRRQTMLKVMHLKPLTLREVADVIGMHESTVSRVTNAKYAQTPRGVLPLKFFFSSGLATNDGEDVSARGIKATIEKMVGDEDAKNPLTDQAIVERLEADGVQIARRTVAKYRDQLGVLSARMRKRV
jgi:RNA polymerase sigma-54 factor